MTHCTRIRPGRDADEAAAGARTFDTCRRHRPRRPTGPIHLSAEQRDLLGRLDETTEDHRPYRARAVGRVRSRRKGRPLVLPTWASGRGAAPRRRSATRHGARGTEAEEGTLQLSGVQPVRSARTAVAALASLATHRSPLWRPSP